MQNIPMGKAVNQALQAPDFKKQLVDRGFIVLGGTRKEFGEFINAEHSKWGDVIKKANIRVE